MYDQFLEVIYDENTNTATSTYRCGNTKEVIYYEGQRGDLVKFTPETWPDYLSKLYGKSLPTLVDGYGYIKYIEDAIDIGVPEEVYTKYALRSKNDPGTRRISSIRIDQYDFDGNLLSSRVVYDNEDAVWFDAMSGGLEIPEGEDAFEYGIKIADGIIPLPNP